MKLYEIKEDYICLLDMIESGEIPEEAIADTLDAVTGELEDKADNIACVIKQLQAEATAIKTEEERLAERRKSREKNAERMKKYLADNLLAVGKTKLETARNKISFRKSETVEIEDFESLIQFAADYPKLLKAQKPQADKAEVKKLIMLGIDVAGCRLQENSNIQIK